jgi:hypothetical protein
MDFLQIESSSFSTPRRSHKADHCIQIKISQSVVHHKIENVAYFLILIKNLAELQAIFFEEWFFGP